MAVSSLPQRDSSGKYREKFGLHYRLKKKNGGDQRSGYHRDHPDISHSGVQVGPRESTTYIFSSYFETELNLDFFSPCPFKESVDGLADDKPKLTVPRQHRPDTIYC